MVDDAVHGGGILSAIHKCVFCLKTNNILNPPQLLLDLSGFPARMIAEKAITRASKGRHFIHIINISLALL